MFGKSKEKYSKEIIPNLFYFNEGQMLDCNMYLLKDKSTGDLCLIDTGNGLSLNSFISAIEKLNLKLDQITKIVLTHDHLDHVMGIYSILKKFDGKTPEIIAHSYTADLLEEGDEKKIIPQMFGITAKRFGITVIPIKNIKRINESDQFKFGDFVFDVLYTPGHSLGSICLYEKAKKLLFSGDVVFPQGSFGRYDFPGCSLEDLIKSIKKISNLNVEILCSGHMQPVLSDASKHISVSLRNIKSL